MSEKPYVFIKQQLVLIRKSLKKLIGPVKISKKLKPLEDYLFTKNPPKLEDKDIKLLLIGDEEEKLHGLLYFCSIRSGNTLKKSSYYAIKLLFRLFDEFHQKREVLNIFTNFDDEEYLQMRLSVHIMSEKPNDFVAYKIVKIIFEKRPCLEKDQYIEGSKAQQKF